ncbi:MAG: DNA alkylation repair protein [Coriobacteriia bacterium]|nr:DNA alkylation repair protein [Coriobacteriia bacterium]
MRTPDAQELLDRLRATANPANVVGMARYGIASEGTLGVQIPVLRGIAKELKPLRKEDPEAPHALAAGLWASGVHEARMLAVFIDIPTLVTREQAEAWVLDIGSWDICDQLMGLFAATPFAYVLAEEWAGRSEEFVKRAGFVLMCALTVHDKKMADGSFLHFLELVEREASDERNFVKKSVNWALRQVGKRSATLHAPAVAVAARLRQSESRAARWVGSDAFRELESEAVHRRLGI